MSNTPAGWYPQPDGQQRYWDGQRWTEHFAPGAPDAAAVGALSAGVAPRPWFKKKRYLIPAGVVGLIVFGSALGGGGDQPEKVVAVEPATKTVESSTPVAPASPKPAVTTAAPKPVVTKPAAPKPAAGPKFGSKVRDGKFEFVVSGMKCGIASVGDTYFNTKAQGQFCRLSVKVTNIGDEAQSMFADNQVAFDSKNRKFSADSGASIYDGDSKVLWEEINPGNTVTGSVFFDVPKGTKLTKVELHDSLFSGGVEVRLAK
ncbi:DUF4352 domain-containing protein [Phycicoccus duodecadis]|uniref:Uncharacterized protein DUF2510 n=1 Tax=Phycicoccus duodecadis TaxID=173053 RepID=A0A2N3YFS6_9MICO|nr:DUF4352 domain-containing protein [Phycicoccus duodecadis]PKW25712.1 uncharacterized protein DUF2510 [Phycicoccus duodecadis]